MAKSVRYIRTTKFYTMKSKVTLIFLFAFLTTILISCGAGRTASCDAYGSIDNVQIENQDLASK